MRKLIRLALVFAVLGITIAGASVRSARSSATLATLTILPGGWIDMTNPGTGYTGVVADGQTDNTAAIQAVIAAQPAYATQVYPSGSIKITGTLDFSTLHRCSMRGTGTAFDFGAGTQFVGAINGPMVSMQPSAGSGSVELYGICFNNSNASGIGVQIEAANGVWIDRCVFQGNTGLIIGKVHTANTGVGIYNTYFAGNLTTYPNGIGCAVRGQGGFYNCRWLGWNEACRISNLFSIFKAQIDVNNTGLVVGLDPNGTVIGNSGAYSGVDCEANLTAIKIRGGAGVFSEFNILGESQPSPGQSQIGIDVQAGNWITFSGGVVGGNYSSECINLVTGPHVSFHNVNATNAGFAGSTVTWQCSGTGARIVLENTDWTSPPSGVKVLN